MLSVLVLFGLSAAFSPYALANQLGIKAGYQTKTNFKFGLFYAIDLSQNLRLQPEVYYTQRNYGIALLHVWLPEQSLRTKDLIKYIEVPLLLTYKLNLKGPIIPVLFGGGYAMFKVGEKLIPMDYLNVMLPRNYTDVNGGVVVGAGFELARGKITLHVDFRAKIGFGWMRQLDYSKSTDILSPINNSKSSCFSILAGLSF
jgi:hypothetical protein